MTIFNEDREYDGRTAGYEERQGIAFRCDCCGGNVYEGETYYQMGSTGYKICEDCFDYALKPRIA